MIARTLGSCLAVAGLGLALAGCATATVSSAPPAGSSDPASLVKTRCTVCHGIERVDAAHHDRVAWQATVDRMRGKGAKLSDAEAASVVDYLTTREAPAP